MKVPATMAMVSGGDDADTHCWRARFARAQNRSYRLMCVAKVLVEALLTTGVAFAAQKTGKEPNPERGCGLRVPETVTL